MNRKARRLSAAKQGKKLRNKQLLTPETTGLSMMQLQQLQQLITEAKRCLKEGKDKETETLCRRCIEIYPNYSTPYALLGDLASRLGRVDLAIVNYEKTLAILPDVAGRWISYGLALISAQRFEEAKFAFGKALKLKPTDYNALNSNARVLGMLGEIPKAVQQFEKLIRLHPERGAAYYHLSQYVKFKEGDKYEKKLRQLEGMLPELADEGDVANAHYALGRFYENIGDYTVSYQHFIKANGLVHEKFGNVSDSRRAAKFEEIKQVFPVNGYWCSDELEASDTEVPIFIVGMPRSGTTLTEQILSSLDGIYGAGELQNISEAGIRISTAFPNKLQSLSKDEPELDNIMNAFGVEAQHVLSNMLSFAPDSVRVIDKMPQNFMNIGVIHLLFPHAKIIHCRRNPIDTCLSNYKTSFSGKLNFTSDMSELGEYYLNYEKIMAHWHEALPGRILDVQYEEVVADLERQARRILDYCNLEWDPVCLEFYKNKRAVATASSNQVRQPIYNSSVGQKERYGNLINPLLEALAPVL